MTGKALLLAVLSCTVFINARSESQLDIITSEIAENNPTLKSLRFRTMSDKSDLAQSNNLDDPEIEVSPQFGKLGKKIGVEASQSFEWPGVYSARRKVASAGSKALDYLEESKVLEIKTTIKTNLIDIINCNKRITLLRQKLVHIDSMVAISERAVEKRELSKLDLNKLRIERLQTNRALNEAARSLSESSASLQILNGGLSCNKYIECLVEFPLDDIRPLSEYLDGSDRNNPSIEYARARSAEANLNKQVLSRSNLPGFTLGYTYEYELGDHFNGFKLGMTLPFFSNRHKKARLDAEISALEAEQNEIEISSRSQITTAFNEINRLDKEIKQYIRALDDGDNLRLLKVAFDSRHITLPEYLLDYNYFLDAQEQLIELCYQRELLMIKISKWL